MDFELSQEQINWMMKQFEKEAEMKGVPLDELLKQKQEESNKEELEDLVLRA